MEEKKTFTGWVREHKKAIIITGAGIATVVGAVLICKNWTTVCDFVTDLPKAKTKNTLHASAQPVIPEANPTIALPEVRNTAISEVSSFVRNLPDGYHASADKVATAAENGFDLVGNQTWVEPFVRRVAA